MSWWKWALGPYMLVIIWAAFYWAPVSMRPNFAEGGTLEPWHSFRIVFFHVPAAWICVIGFLVSMVASIKVLRGYTPKQDDRAMAAAQLGFLFAALALLSGMLWARHDWGALWNWDPRQTSVAVLLLIYGAYFALRGSVSDPRNRARLSAVYSVVAFVTVPFLIFVVPRIMYSLHPSPVIPNESDEGSMNSSMRVVMYASVVGFLGIFSWLMGIRTRVERLARGEKA